MKLARRQVISGMLGVAAAGLLSGCESVEQRLTRTSLPLSTLPPQSALLDSPALRLLNRTAYGPRPGDVMRVIQMGVDAYVAEQLHPQAVAEGPVLAWRLRSLGDTLNADAGTLFDQDDQQAIATLRQASLLRTTYSRHQLYERMVEFWTDHFNIYAFKGEGPQLKVVDDRDTIRKHALGRFRDLLGASAKSAAMLGYLDNGVNHKGVPNENYARELMELHTLGISGGYTQQDVQEVACCFTGWTAQRHWRRGQFVFDAAAHDTSAKRVLGQTLPAGGGLGDGERVLDLLAAHPATARHIAHKLCVHFLGYAPPGCVQRLATVYLRTDGSISALLSDLLLSSELMQSPPILKRPLDYAVSALRAFNVDTDGGLPLQKHLESMGKPLFGWPMPNGFPEAAAAWTGTLIPRWNFALALAGGQIANTSLDIASLTAAGKSSQLKPQDTLLEFAFGTRSDTPQLATLRECQAAYADPAAYLAIIIMSPAFQWR